jgi:hypothetical protein
MKNSFEAGVESELDLDTAFERAEEVLGDPIDMRSFTLYKDIESDIRYVEEKKIDFAKSHARESETEAYFRKTAKIFEAIIFDQIERSNWLGESAMTIQASEYDDIHNGTDTIVEFEEENNDATHLALAIDVTTSQEHLDRKLDRVKKEINSGTLTRIKYFYSESMGIKGEKTKVPRVIIGVDRKTVADLTSKWVENKNKELGEHIVQVIIIEQIITQLIKFKEYAEKIGNNDVVRVYERTIRIVEKIREEKGFTQEQLDDAGLDHVSEMLGYGLQAFNK